MSRRMIYLCYGKPASGKSMLTTWLNKDEVYVCELYSIKALGIKVVQKQIQQALQQFEPKPIKYSNELKPGVYVIVFETNCIETKKFVEKILKQEVKDMTLTYAPGFTTIDFVAKVRGERSNV